MEYKINWKFGDTIILATTHGVHAGHGPVAAEVGGYRDDAVAAGLAALGAGRMLGSWICGTGFDPSGANPSRL
jgi:hypothetical protein